MVSGLWQEGYSEYEDWQKRWRSEEISQLIAPETILIMDEARTTRND